MKFLFVSGLKHLPQAYGGVQSNAHEMALELIRRGHDVALAAGLLPSGLVGFRTRLMRKIRPSVQSHDSFLGYPVYRQWDILQSLSELVRVTKPDVAILQPSQHLPIAHELVRIGIPVIVYFHDVLFDEHEGDIYNIDNVTFISNSQFTARKYKESYHIDTTVIEPIFRSERYRTTTLPYNVTFINPIPEKGSDIALKLVEICPDVNFCFVPSWGLSKTQKQFLKEQANLHSNLRIAAPTMNMKDVYGRAKVLLVPSQLEEAWGRVATEAQFSGIPVVASNRGGLPEAVGPGGVLLDPDGPIEAWAAAIRQLWTDEVYYRKLSAAARAHSNRPALNPDVQIDALLDVAQRAIAARNGPVGGALNEGLSDSERAVQSAGALR